MQMRKDKVNIILLLSIAALVVILIALTITSLVYYETQAGIVEDMRMQEYEGYVRHYAFIAEDMESTFWEEIYEGAGKQGEETGVYLECIGIGTASEYTKEERMRMAVAARVDGIVLEADETPEMQQLIDEAEENNIPVVTVMRDSYGSGRKSFIGIGGYNLGREYGRQIVRIATKNTKRVLVIADGNMDNNTQNIIVMGIRETLSNEGNHLDLTIETTTVGDRTAFGSEETIRDIFRDTDNLPEIIICLNEQDTESACLAVVDYNVVGEVNILGYSISEDICNAIERNILAATIVTDTEQIGINSVDALNEYIETGHVNDYIVMEVNAVTTNNIREYAKDAETEIQP